MYTRPSKGEQCLHNVLKVVEALRHIGVDYDIQVSQKECFCFRRECFYRRREGA